MMKLTESDRRAIVAQHVAGKGPTEIAKIYGVSRQTISTFLNDFRRSREGKPGEDVIGARTGDYKQELKSLAVPALKRSLSDTTEVHKAANTAVNVMKGLGEFREDRLGDVNLFVAQIANLPADWQKHYVSSDDVTEDEPGVVVINGHEYITSDSVTDK